MLNFNGPGAGDGLHMGRWKRRLLVAGLCAGAVAFVGAAAAREAPPRDAPDKESSAKEAHGKDAPGRDAPDKEASPKDAHGKESAAKGANEFPQFDIAGSCSKVADQQGCQQAEADARAKLAPLWGQLPAQKRTACHKLGANRNSYITVLSCATREGAG
jgi:hypothetical protein